MRNVPNVSVYRKLRNVSSLQNRIGVQNNDGGNRDLENSRSIIISSALNKYLPGIGDILSRAVFVAVT